MIVRRRPLAVVALSAVAVVTVGTLAAAPSQAAELQRRTVSSADSAELNLVFILDGLRPDSITQAETPNLYRLRESGVNFPNSHAVIPTVTRVNSAVIGTGNQPGNNGIVGNSVYLPSVSATTTVDTGLASVLLRLRQAEGRISLTQTLGERLQARGKKLVTVGSGSSGGSLLLNPTAPDGTGVMINAGSSDGPRAFPASVGQEVERRFGAAPVAASGTVKVDYAIRVLNDYIIPDLDADVVMTWMTEPDGTQHERGVGSPEAKAVIRNDDRNIGLVLDNLQRRGLADKTNIMILSDHGFSLTDYAVNLSTELVGAGLKASATSTDVVVANTGSVALHVQDRDPGKIQAISRFLLQRQDVATVYTAATRPRGGVYRTTRDGSPVQLARGWVDGTYSLELIGHANPQRGADVVVSFPWTDKPNSYGVSGTATTSAGGTGVTGVRTGVASTHGSFSPYDITNTLFGWGVDFKDGVTSSVPAGNVDVAPTLLALEGIGSRGTDGRVLSEALYGGPNPRRVTYRTWELTLAQRNYGYHGLVTISTVGNQRYVDQARRLTTSR